jgi:hypothetical protein
MSSNDAIGVLVALWFAAFFVYLGIRTARYLRDRDNT